MRKFYTLFLFLLISKVFYCQNFLNFNSTPYQWFYMDYSIFSDSSDNKYTFGNVASNYSTSKFNFAFANPNDVNFLLIKYDSSNNIKYYKKITANRSGVNTSYEFFKSFYSDNYLYITFFAFSQYSYDNTSYAANNNLVVLKIDPSNGNLLSSLAIQIPELGIYDVNISTTRAIIQGLFIKDNKISIFLETKVATVINSIPINVGNYCATYSLTGNFILAKNLVSSAWFSSMLEYNGSIYLFVADFTYKGHIDKYDLNYNLVKTVFYGAAVYSPIILNNSILFASNMGNYASPEDKNKIFLTVIDTELNIIRETKWGQVNGYSLFISSSQAGGQINIGQNSFRFLDIKNNKIVFSYIAALSQDSSLGCSAFGRSSTNLIIHTLDTNLDCKSFIQITNGEYFLNSLGLLSNYYKWFVAEFNLTANKQISFLINSAFNPSPPVDTLFRFYLNSHKNPLGKMQRGNKDWSVERSPNIVSLHFDKWIETFMPDKINYCVGDTLKLAYKKVGEWHPGTTFRLEISSNTDFSNGTVRLIGTFTDPITTNDSILYTNLKIPNMGGGLFYIRIRSIGPDRTSNIADTAIYIYNLPAADAGKDIVVCEGDSVSLEGNNFNNSFYWTSSIPNIISDSLQINSKVFTTDSAYCVLHTRNSPGCDGTDTVYIKVIPKISLNFKIDTLYPKCINSNLRFSLTANYNDSIMLNWGDGTDTIVKTNSHTLTHNYTSLGPKIVSIKAIANKCLDSMGFSFVVRTPFHFQTANDTTICKGTLTSLWGIATGGDSVFTYILRAPSVSLQNSSGLFLVSPDSTTIYSIGRINACVNDTVWKTINVTVRPPLALQLNSTDTTLCKGSSFNIKAAAAGGKGSYDYYLKKNGVTQQSNTTGTFNITANSNETYTVLVTDNCTVPNDSATVNIKLFNALQFIQALPDVYLCANETTTFKANTNKGSGTVSYEWRNGTGTILSITDTLQITPASTTQIILKVTDACMSIYDTAWIYQFAAASGTQLTTDVLSGCAPLTVNFETPTLSYSNSQACIANWDFGDGNTLLQNFTNTSPTLKAKHTYANAGVYKVEVKVGFKNNSTTCYTFDATVEALLVPQITLSITPKKITLPKTQCTATIATTNADSVVIDWADGFTDNVNLNLSLFSITHDYADTGHYNVKATAYNKNTCYTETNANVYHADTFMCFIPNAFTPNRDNLNETFKPMVSFCKSYELTIFNRWGEVLYQATYTLGKNQQPGWTGEENAADTYLYILTAKDGDNNRYNFNGTVMLLR